MTRRTALQIIKLELQKHNKITDEAIRAAISARMSIDTLRKIAGTYKN
jgi:hypothetical protein